MLWTVVWSHYGHQEEPYYLLDTEEMQCTIQGRQRHQLTGEGGKSQMNHLIIVTYFTFHTAVNFYFAVYGGTD